MGSPIDEISERSHPDYYLNKHSQYHQSREMRHAGRKSCMPVASIRDRIMTASPSSLRSSMRHYLARLHRKTFCYSKSKEMLCFSIKLLIYYLREKKVFLQ